MTFAEVLETLRNYDQNNEQWHERAIFVADPQAPHSEAFVEWSSLKGGLPAAASRNGRVFFYYLTPVRKALTLLGSDYDRLVSGRRLDELCELLVKRVEDDLVAFVERTRR